MKAKEITMKSGTSIEDSLKAAKTRAAKVKATIPTPVETIITERASILFKCIAIGGEITNLTNMLFMKKGDVYMEYTSSFPKTKVDYPHLRAAIEIDLLLAEVQMIDRLVIVKGKNTIKKVACYPWGTMSIKMKAHSLAVSMLKTYQRRALKFGKETKLVAVTVFDKYSKYGTPEATQENKTIDITYKTVHKVFDERRALDFLNSFLRK